MRPFFHRWRRDTRGNMLIETALVMPVLIILLVGGFEVTRMFLLHNKVNRAISEVNDIVSRLGMGSGAPVTVCRSLFADIFSSVDDIMNPYNDGTKVHLVMTGVNNDGTSSKVLWQTHYPASDTGYSDVSSTGIPGSAAVFPSTWGFVLQSSQATVVTELTYNYTPLIFNSASGILPFLGARIIKQNVMMAPRAAYINVIDGGC